MRFSILLSLFCLLLCPARYGLAEQVSDPKEAATLYRAGQFELAAKAYSALVSAEPQNPYYLYNLGNSYFKMGSLGKAIASYRKAFELEPRDPDIRANLSFAMKKAGDELVPAGMPEVLHTLYHFLSKNELAGLFWILCWAALLPGAGAFWPSRARRYLLPPALLFAAFAAASGIWLAARAVTAYKNPAVVTASQAEVRTGPGDNFSAVASVPEGHTVNILQSKEDWLLIGVRDENLKGWVKSSAVEKI